MAYSILVIAWKALNLSFSFVYITSGLVTVIIAFVCIVFYPRIETTHAQVRRMIIRKKYWLAPLIITIILLGALIIYTQGTVVAPFIYTIF